MTGQTAAWWQSLPPAQGAPPPPPSPADAPDDGVATITVRPQSAAPQGGGSEWWQSLPAAERPAAAQAAGQPPPMGMLPQLWQGAKEGVMGLANTATALPHAIGDLAAGAFGLRNPVQQMQAPDFQPPQGFGESAARAIGQGIPTLPLLGAGEAAAAPTLLRGAAAAGRSMLSNAAPVIAGQVGGEAAQEMAPEPLKPAAQMLGALATGGAAGGVQTLGEGLIRGGARAAGSMGLAPKQEFQGQPGSGGDAVRATAQQADAARGQLEAAANQTPGGAERFQQMLEPSQSSAATQAVSPTGQHEVVPGSQPTTAQVAPLPGIAKLEDTVRSTGAGPAFMQRAEEQNAARVGAIQGLKPQADPAAVGQFFKDQMAALDASGEQQIAGQRGAVQQATEGLGGQGAPAAYGQEMRGAIQGALDPVQAQRRALWQAVDPDGTLALHADPVRDAFNQITKELTPSDALTGGEKAVLTHAQDIAGRNGAIPYSELQSFRSNILSAQRQSAFGEPLSTQGMRRLSILKDAVDQSVSNAVEQQVAHETRAVAAGQMAPEQTIMGRLQAEQQDWYAGRNAAAATGGIAGAGAGGNAGTGSSAVSGARRAIGQAAGGPGNAARGEGVQDQAQPLAANFDAAAAERDAAAREATFREKERFGRGPVGEVLARGKSGAPNNVLDADVPAKFFTGRPSEPEQVQSFVKAVGTPRAAALARDYLVSDLRRSGIVGQDGTLNADQFARWQDRRAETIKLFPGLKEEFANAGSAQRALNDVQASHAAALKDYQNGVAKHFLNEEPARAVQKMLGSADRVKLMQQAIGRMQGNVDAVQSLKGHVIDYILDKLTSSPKATEGNAAAPNISDVGSLRPDAFKDWIGANNPWLKRLFGGQGMQSLEMVGADLRRQQLRGIASSGSPTVERGIAAQQHGSVLRQHLPTVMALLGEKIAETGAGALGMHGVAGLGVEAAGMALPVLAHALRQRGIQTTSDLVREAMLHPSLARELMARPKQPTIGNILQRRIAHNLTAITAASENSQESHQ